MTTWTEGVTGTIWDAGATVWDKPGTVALTYWDASAATAWTEQSAEPVTYRRAGGKTTWDGGKTVWDHSANVVQTAWDRPTADWAETPRNSVEWTE